MQLSKIIATTAMATGLMFGTSLVQAATLTVYTTTSVSADWGIGPKVKAGLKTVSRFMMLWKFALFSFGLRLSWAPAGAWLRQAC